MSNVLKLVILSVFIFCVVGLSSAATIHGTIYEWYSLEPLKNAILNINSTPPQRFVAKDGVYEFELEEGKYCMETKYYEGNLLLYHSKEDVSIETGGDFVFDVIMFPDIDLGMDPFNEFNMNLSIDEGLLRDMKKEKENEWISWMAVVLIIIGCIHIFRRKSRMCGNQRKVSPEDLRNQTEVIPDDLKEIMDILRKHGGRMTQLELRGVLHYSEAKVSLMLSDLENRGLVERFKKGRGNIIILKDM